VLGEDRGWAAIRAAMGHTRQFAERVNLAAMTPHDELASTKYCLANPGREYIIYQPAQGEAFSVTLSPGLYQLGWFNPVEGAPVGETRLEIKDQAEPQRFQAPFSTDAVLLLQKTRRAE
jgi:hypothetical protein